MRKYQTTILLLILFSSVAAIAKDDTALSPTVYCFINGKENPKLNFEMRFFSEQYPLLWSAGYIRYQNSKELIPIVLKSSVPNPNSEPNLRLPENIITWTEVYKGKITGEYEMEIHGAIVGYMTYKNFKKNKSYDFGMDESAVTEQGCVWEKIR